MKLYDTIKLLVPVISDSTGRNIPAGSRGVVVEIFDTPSEAYAVDFAFPDDSVVTGFVYENVMLTPDQVENFYFIL